MARHFKIPSDHVYAPQVPSALIELSNQGDGVQLTRVQAEAIGALRLIQLVGLEIEKLTGEYKKLLGEIGGFEQILADEKLITEIIRQDTIEIREKYGDPRKTKIERS